MSGQGNVVDVVNFVLGHDVAPSSDMRRIGRVQGLG